MVTSGTLNYSEITSAEQAEAVDPGGSLTDEGTSTVDTSDVSITTSDPTTSGGSTDTTGTGPSDVSGDNSLVDETTETAVAAGSTVLLGPAGALTDPDVRDAIAGQFDGGSGGSGSTGSGGSDPATAVGDAISNAADALNPADDIADAAGSATAMAGLLAVGAYLIFGG